MSCRLFFLSIGRSFPTSTPPHGQPPLPKSLKFQKESRETPSSVFQLLQWKPQRQIPPNSISEQRCFTHSFLSIVYRTTAIFQAGIGTLTNKVYFILSSWISYNRAFEVRKIVCPCVLLSDFEWRALLNRKLDFPFKPITLSRWACNRIRTAQNWPIRKSHNQVTRYSGLITTSRLQYLTVQYCGCVCVCVCVTFTTAMKQQIRLCTANVTTN